MDRKKLLVVGGFIICVFAAFIFLLFGSGVFGPEKYNDNVSADNSTPESTGVSAAFLNFKTFVKGISPLAIYNYVSYKGNWHLFGKDNSYQKGTYSQSNYYKKTWADDIQKNYPLNNNA